MTDRDRLERDGLSEEILKTLREAGTATISDAFDRLGVVPPVLDTALAPLGRFQAFAGPAYTISGKEETYAGADQQKLAAIDVMQPGQIAVWASQGARGVCCFGDLLASAMQVRGCLGIVVDGGVRDTAYLAHCGVPIVARYRTPAQGVGRRRVDAHQTAIKVRGALDEWVTINPGDIIIVDTDGAVAVPKSMLTEIVSQVANVPEVEAVLRAEIAAGLPLLKALDKYGRL